jgi:hypothetical protein
VVVVVSVNPPSLAGQIPDAVCDPSCFNNLQEIDWSYNKVPARCILQYCRTDQQNARGLLTQL